AGNPWGVTTEVKEDAWDGGNALPSNDVWGAGDAAPADTAWNGGGGAAWEASNGGDTFGNGDDYTGGNSYGGGREGGGSGGGSDCRNCGYVESPILPTNAYTAIARKATLQGSGPSQG